MPDNTLPSDFVDLRSYLTEMGARGLVTDIKYASRNNFLGDVVPGYEAARAWLTQRAADALLEVQKSLLEDNHGLLIFDAYRPQRAVDAFIRWSQNSDNSNKDLYYPDLDKAQLFELGYLAKRSSHSRGSTLDLTIVKFVGGHYEPLDMGSRFDFFGPVSHSTWPDISAVARHNRNWLASLMNQAGFDGLATEWWHYTLRDEPWPKRYFDVPIR